VQSLARQLLLELSGVAWEKASKGVSMEICLEKGYEEEQQ